MKLSEAGNTLLYATVFIPVVLGGAALAFDVSGINLRAERVQSTLDTIVLDAAHALPDAELAKGRAIYGIRQISEHITDIKS